MTKRILLSLILWVGVVFSANAQRSDGFFKNNDDTYNNRGEINNNITLGGVTNNENPTEAPIGSGLLIMVAAGAGYAVARRKNAARKGMTMLLALGLILGMTQCKKNTVTPVSTDNKINITLNANYGGEKTTFDPTNGTFAWNTSGIEYINVGGKVSGYLGQLSNAGHEGTGDFSGSIKTPDAGETMLYFFYLGNGDHKNAATVDFSNQNGIDVTNCHIAIGSVEYTGQESFTVTLNMAMAIAYFDLSGFNNDSKTAETVYLSGNDIYTTASVNYNDGTITGNSKGMIKVGTANNGMYVALIPSVTTSTTLNFNSSSKAGSMAFNNGIKPAYFYSNSGGALLVEAAAGSGIPGTFSVSATKKVFFSKGNLQYIGSAATPYWKFADNQYDMFGTNTSQNSNSTTVDRDLFGWGTSGWNNGNKCYQPYETSNKTTGDYASSKGFGYGPTDGSNYTYSLTDDGYTKSDWGVNNTISNGGTGWRTMTGNTGGEWDYLLNSRAASTINETKNARYIQATVCDVQGIILFPDVYTHPLASYPSQINMSNNYWSTNVYNETDWLSMEAAGAIFLPRAGYRNGTTVTTGYMYYWTSTVNNASYSYYISFANYNMNCAATYSKYYGLPVRLVKDVE